MAGYGFYLLKGKPVFTWELGLPDLQRVKWCGARMIVIEVFERGCEPSWRPTPGRIDTS